MRIISSILNIFSRKEEKELIKSIDNTHENIRKLWHNLLNDK